MTRSVLRIFFAVSLCISFAGSTFAEMPPLLKAKGKQQQCSSLKVWTDKAEELGGKGVIGGEIISDYFVIQITPAFADIVFVPLIGKPYKSLSKSEKKKIYNIVDRCLTKTGTRGFLPLAFETSSRPKNSTHRDLIAALEKVTDDYAVRAQSVADANAERQRKYDEGRPELIARSLAVDPKAIKRQRLTKRMCHANKSGWSFLYNEYVYNGEAVIASNDGHRGHGIRPCNNAMSMERFVPNVTALLREPNPHSTVLSIGDICGSNSEVLFLYPTIKALPKYDQYPSSYRTVPYSRDVQTPAYPFYVPSGTDGVPQPRIISRVESDILAVREIVMKQCRTVPESIRVSGGALKKWAPPKPRSRTQELPDNLDYWEFYSGTFYPNEPEKRLVHSDRRLAATYAALAQEYGAYIRSKQEEARNESDGSLALGFLLLILAAQYSADPCNDMDIPYATRDAAGCFD